MDNRKLLLRKSLLGSKIVSTTDNIKNFFGVNSVLSHSSQEMIKDIIRTSIEDKAHIYRGNQDLCELEIKSDIDKRLTKLREELGLPSEIGWDVHYKNFDVNGVHVKEVQTRIDNGNYTGNTLYSCMVRSYATALVVGSVEIL